MKIGNTDTLQPPLPLEEPPACTRVQHSVQSLHTCANTRDTDDESGACSQPKLRALSPQPAIQRLATRQAVCFLALWRGCRNNDGRIATRFAPFALGAFRARRSGRTSRASRTRFAFCCGRAGRSLWTGRAGNRYGHGRRGRRRDYCRAFTSAQCQRGQCCCNCCRISHDDSFFVSSKN